MSPRRLLGSCLENSNVRLSKTLSELGSRRRRQLSRRETWSRMSPPGKA